MCNVDALTAESDCVLMAWDWRKDLVIAAKHLDKLIMKIRDLRPDPDLKNRYCCADATADVTFFPI